MKKLYLCVLLFSVGNLWAQNSNEVQIREYCNKYSVPFPFATIILSEADEFWYARLPRTLTGESLYNATAEKDIFYPLFMTDYASNIEIASIEWVICYLGYLKIMYTFNWMQVAAAYSDGPNNVITGKVSSRAVGYANRIIERTDAFDKLLQIRDILRQ